jgi:crossover junction endodeoxyribonuclease RuvC
MKVLAIDPGYGRCGVAVVEKVNGREMLMHSDCIETASGDEFPERLAAIASSVVSVIESHKPDCMAIEKLYFTNNAKTAMRVAEVRGALLQIAAGRELPVFEYGPGQIKSAATGSGSADKRQVAKMLHALMRIEKKIRFDDEYDAIAIGVAHLALSR